MDEKLDDARDGSTRDTTDGAATDPRAAATGRAGAGDAPPPASDWRAFVAVLVNTGVANVTTSYLWFALTFWVYLETRSVLATGVIGGAFMLFVALSSMLFGTLVDRYRKHAVMLMSALGTLVLFGLAGVCFLLVDELLLLDIAGPWFWIFTVLVLAGAVLEQLRNIALSTTVTLLVEPERRANANGLVGMVQGLAFLVTSVLSGFSISLLGMGGTVLVALALTAAAGAHLLLIRIPEPEIAREEGRTGLSDVVAGVTAVRRAPGLFALILFTTFNNLVGGVYMALMDPYGLTLFGVEMWGVVLAVTSTGMLIGGALVAKLGLGRNPVRTMLLLVAFTGLLGATFALREWWWLYAVGIWLFMMVMPAVEAAEQTVIQRVVPYETQGRVFGFAMTFEALASPITSFLIAPIAEFAIIPYMRTDAGRGAWGWLLGEGEARGIALVFLCAGLVTVLLGLGALLTRSYRLMSERYTRLEAMDPGNAADEADADATTTDAEAGASRSEAPADADGEGAPSERPGREL